MMYYSFNDSFIGYGKNFRNELFSGSDTEEHFQKNPNLNEFHWYYRTSKISYIRNSLGHRTKEINDTDLDNYILSVGCSLTEGIGIEYDKTYTHVLASMLECDYYNMGIGGHSIQTAIHNTVIWFNKIKKKPKLLIVQVPEPTRFTLINDDDIFPCNINSTDKGITEFAVVGDQLNYWNTVYNLAMLQFRSFNVPMIEILPLGSSKSTAPNILTYKISDMGRDNHPGILSNKNLAIDIFNMYQKQR